LRPGLGGVALLLGGYAAVLKPVGGVKELRGSGLGIPGKVSLSGEHGSIKAEVRFRRLEVTE
jgi:hypothetical protein